MAELDEPTFERPLYMEALNKFKDSHIIKILTGVRRCGKSKILELYKSELKKLGVQENQIIMKCYTSMEFAENYSASQMYNDLKKSINANLQKTYLLLDEVQEVDGWEKVLNSIFESYNADIYVTGSNSKLLSSEISTYLSGRYVLIPVFTLSFREYIEFKKNAGDKNAVLQDKTNILNEYIRMGAFPLVALSNYSQQDAEQIVDGIYSSVVTKDIARRHNISNIDMFNRVVRFVCENLGKTFSAKTIFDFFKSQQRSVAIETIYNYLAWLEEAFIIYRCQRYDLQGKEVLKTQEKFYLADVSIKYSQLGFTQKAVSAVLENIVYIELLRRGFEVHIGKLGEKEIDFVASKHDERLYVQVCRVLPEDDNREIENLLAIKDSFPKIVITLDELASGTTERGVKIVHLRDWLLEEP